MPFCQGRWTLAKLSNVVVDPYFFTLTGYQRDADRKQISASKNHHSKASRVPKSCDSSSSNRHDRRRDRFGPKLGEEPEFTESGQICQKKNSGKTKYTDNEGVRDKRHERRPATGLQAPLKSRNRNARRRRVRQAAKASPVAEQARVQAYKAAGLNKKGLWSFSQRNRAKALAQIEPAPDVNQMDLFVPRK